VTEFVLDASALMAMLREEPGSRKVADAIAGARMSVFKVVESPGKYKESDAGVWNAQEIADHFDSISKV